MPIKLDCSHVLAAHGIKIAADTEKLLYFCTNIEGLLNPNHLVPWPNTETQLTPFCMRLHLRSALDK